MIIYFLTLSLFSIHISPYFLMEQSFFEHNSSDTIFYEYPNIEDEYDTGYVVSELGDVIAVGLTFGEKYLWTSLSFGLPTYCFSIKFLPFLDVNAGIRSRNIRGYTGFHVPLKNNKNVDKMFRDVTVEETNGFHSIYAGVGAYHTINKFMIDFDLQLRKEYGSYSKFCTQSIPGEFYLHRDAIDTSYIQTILNTQIGYIFRGYSPFVFLSINQRNFSEPFSFRAGLGILLGSSPIEPAKYEAKTTQSFHYYGAVYPRKPNIYLYPVEPCSVMVMLEPDGRITVSEPPYESGWNVYAFPDGTIQDVPGYLFYEAKINKLRVKNKGWCIKQDELSSFFYSVLTSYGFNARETNDFVAYWKNHLPLSPYYVIYPAVTEEIDKVCPVTVFPEPDALLRMWFVIEPVKVPITVESPSQFLHLTDTASW